MNNLRELSPQALRQAYSIALRAPSHSASAARARSFIRQIAQRRGIALDHLARLS